MTDATDVLVIGGGLAGCMAAIEAAKHRLEVTLVDKGMVGRSGSSPYAGGGTAAVFSGKPWPATEGDSKELHHQDVLREGGMINDPSLVSTMVENAADSIVEMERLGALYSRSKDGKLTRIKTMGHSLPRTYIAAGEGYGLMEVLRKETFHRRVKVIENVMVTKIFVNQGRAAGAFGIDVGSGQERLFPAKAIVLAAGSATGLFKYCSTPFRTTGDAFALAWDLGFKLANLEFVEFTVIPKVGRKVLFSGGINPFLGRGSRLFNAEGERIMERYDPERLEVSSRSLIVRAVEREMQEGRGPVYNDCTHFSPEAMAELKSPGSGSLVNKLASLGVDLKKDRFEWVPAVHSCLGGIVINKKSETGIGGLYAAGECTNGIHGANRMSGNAFSECLVFGKKAGRCASLYARKAQETAIKLADLKRERERIKSLFNSHGEEPFKVEKRLRELAPESIGVIRREDQLKLFLPKIKELEATPLKVTGPGQLIKALEIRSLMLTAQLVAASALYRTESRGQHFREDYPAAREAWLTWTTLEKAGRDLRPGRMNCPRS